MEECNRVVEQVSLGLRCCGRITLNLPRGAPDNIHEKLLRSLLPNELRTLRLDLIHISPHTKASIRFVEIYKELRLKTIEHYHFNEVNFDSNHEFSTFCDILSEWDTLSVLTTVRIPPQCATTFLQVLTINSNLRRLSFNITELSERDMQQFADLKLENLRKLTVFAKDSNDLKFTCISTAATVPSYTSHQTSI
ncbi:hypothetical protein HK098_005185 [Nowakowskiella sp. JEL0407]|nr:hypothetical protein HK098_005185 [Nowakowskiella sp. JEL0407]